MIAYKLSDFSFFFLFFQIFRTQNRSGKTNQWLKPLCMLSEHRAFFGTKYSPTLSGPTARSKSLRQDELRMTLISPDLRLTLAQISGTNRFSDGGNLPPVTRQQDDIDYCQSKVKDVMDCAIWRPHSQWSRSTVVKWLNNQSILL